MSVFQSARIFIITAITVGVCSGCSTLWSEASREARGASSSLVDYLYPNDELPPAETASTRLELPLRVGLAFVPTNHGATGLSEADKQELLSQVKQTFASRDYVQDITIVPQSYMMQSRGHEGMKQLARLYSFDVFALVSYDQSIHLQDRKSSLMYWTIVGAYVFKGTHNEVSTFVDLAVVDVSSKKLLLRAAGVDRASSNSTAVELGQEVRDNRRQGFAGAMDQMIVNFDQELVKFEEAVSDNPTIEVVHRSSGGGGLGTWTLLILFGLGFIRLVRRPRPISDEPASRDPLK